MGHYVMDRCMGDSTWTAHQTSRITPLDANPSLSVSKVWALFPVPGPLTNTAPGPCLSRTPRRRCPWSWAVLQPCPAFATCTLCKGSLTAGKGKAEILEGCTHPSARSPARTNPSKALPASPQWKATGLGQGHT